jgi:hypothetical protein
MQLYIHRDGQQFGPYSVEDVRGYLASGNLLAEDLAWHEGAADWTPLAQVVGLASAPSPVQAEPAQATELSWIPPRRESASSPSAQIARKASVNGTERPVPSPNVAGRVKPASRKKSSSVNGFTRRQRAMAARQMGLGAVIFGVGTAVTYFSYEAAASSPGGGVYLIAGGAIFFGAIRFVTGLLLFFKA